MADLISVRDGASNHVPNLERKILSLEEEVKVLRMELEAMAWAVTMKEAERSAMEAEVSQARQMASEIDEYKRGMVSEMEELKRKLEVSMDAEERMAREITFLESEALHDAMDSRSLIESLRTDIRYKEICLAAAAAAALDQLQVLAPSPYNQASDYTMNMLPRSSSLVPWQADMKSSQIEEATMSQGTDLAMALPGADLAMAPQGPDLAMAPPSIQDQQSSINRNATNTSAASLLKSSENIPVLAPAHEAKEISSVLPSGSDSSSSSKHACIFFCIYYLFLSLLLVSFSASFPFYLPYSSPNNPFLTYLFCLLDFSKASSLLLLLLSQDVKFLAERSPFFFQY